MDPLSITASIIAIVGAGGKVVKGLDRLVGLRHAPDVLLALNNEVTEVHLIVEDVQNVLMQQKDVVDTVPPPSVLRALENAQASSLRLERLIAYDLTTIDGDNGGVRLDKSAWLHAEKQVQNIKVDLRANKADLSAALSLLAW